MGHPEKPSQIEWPRRWPKQPIVGPCCRCGDPYGAPLVDPFVCEGIVEERGPPLFWCGDCYLEREDEV